MNCTRSAWYLWTTPDQHVRPYVQLKNLILVFRNLWIKLKCVSIWGFNITWKYTNYFFVVKEKGICSFCHSNLFGLFFSGTAGYVGEWNFAKTGKYYSLVILNVQYWSSSISYLWMMYVTNSFVFLPISCYRLRSFGVCFHNQNEWSHSNTNILKERILL